MVRSIRTFAVLLALPVLLAVAQTAAAQGVVVSAPAPYCPPTVSYYAPPVVSYYAPPAVTYYRAPVVSYYAAPVYTPPAVSYYAPPAVVYPAPSAVTTYYRYGLFGRRIGATTYYYP